MLQDPTDQYITAILSQCHLHDRDILEIGCGKGRITRDLARHARRVVATDPDATALGKATAAITAANVEFIHAPTGMPNLPAATFDLVIYTLSFHHIPPEAMVPSLQMAATLLRPGGVIVIVEPGDGGSLTEAKERFGAGSGDERPARASAIAAMRSMEGWTAGETFHFRTLFQFEDDEDFLCAMLPGYRQQPQSFIAEITAFLDGHRTSEGILLDAGRRLNVLRPEVRLEDLRSRQLALDPDRFGDSHG